MEKRILLPKNLELQELDDQNNPEYRVDHIAYIIYLIIHLSGKQKKQKVTEGWTALSTALLKQQGIAKASKILKHLEQECGVIECDHRYKPGEKCKWYRLAEPYRELGFKEHIIKQSALLKRLRKNERVRKDTARQLKHLTQHFNENLTIDMDAAMHAINVKYEEQIALPPEERDKNKDKNKKLKPKDPYTVYTYAYTAIHKFSEKDFTYNVSETNNRLNTNLTSLPKIVRPYITYSGEPLCNIDIKNSQPYMSLLLLQPEFYETISDGDGRVNFSSLTKDVLQDIPLFSKGINTSSSPLMCPNIMQLTDNDSVTLFTELVCSGRIYDYIKDDIGDPTRTRNDVKIDFLTAMYSSNKYHKNVVKQRFRELFPEVYELFALYKRKNYKALPIALQQIEANIMLKRVTKRIAEEFPGLPIYTIHDSVVTLMAYRKRVVAIMEEEIERAIGFKPTLDDEEVWEG